MATEEHRQIQNFIYKNSLTRHIICVENHVLQSLHSPICPIYPIYNLYTLLLVAYLTKRHTTQVFKIGGFACRIVYFEFFS